MSDNLLISLQKYSSRPNYNPLENFTTEAFAWLLRNNEHALKAFLNLLDQKLGKNCADNTKLSDADPKTVHCETQVYLSGAGIADFVLYLGFFTIVVEVKLWASGTNDQVKNYKKKLAENHPNVISVFLAPGLRDQREIADIDIRWAEVYEAIKPFESEDRCAEFLGFLESQGLSPGLDLDCAAMIYAPEVYRIFSSLPQIWKRIANNLKAEIASPNNSFPVIFYHNSWGRMGVMLKRSESNDNEWNPALTIGVMYDPQDHAFEPITKDFGAVFLLIIDVGSKFWSKIELGATKTPWTDFKTELKIACDQGSLRGWNFFDSYEYYRNNPHQCNKWHPIAIFKPVSEILKKRAGKGRCYNTDELEDEFEKLTKELLNKVNTMETFPKLLDYLEQK